MSDDNGGTQYLTPRKDNVPTGTARCVPLQEGGRLATVLRRGAYRVGPSGPAERSPFTLALGLRHRAYLVVVETAHERSAVRRSRSRVQSSEEQSRSLRKAA